MRFQRLVLLLAIILAGPRVFLPAQDPNTVAVEALHRLKGVDLESNAALKAAVNKVLDRITDQSAFVELVRDFDLKERAPQVLGFVRRHPEDLMALDGLRFVLKHNASLVGAALETDTNAPSFLGLLGVSGNAESVPLLAAISRDEKRSAATRESATHALVMTHEGAKQLLGMVEEKRLSGALAMAALNDLQSVRWPEIKEQALKLGTLAIHTQGKLPPKAELLRMEGNKERGARILRKPEVGCLTCHQVNGEGVDFGPRLSEIGAKLGKDALYDAIVDPSVGISFGFEAWLITLKDGDEALGLIASETEEVVTLKLQGGLTTRVSRKDIAKREKQTQSIMPVGLQDNLRAQEFADLLEYLSTLKKATQ